VNGNNFQPQVVIFYTQRVNTSVVDGGDTTADQHVGIGAAVSASSQWAFATRWNFGAGNNQITVRDDACLLRHGGNGSTTPVAASLVSMNSNGFAINITNAPGVAYAVGFVALAGLDAVELGIMLSPTVTGQVDYTLAGGFNPTAIMVTGGSDVLNSVNTSTDAMHTYGWANLTNQFVAAASNHNGNAGSAHAHSYMSADKILASIDSQLSEVTLHEASFVGFPPGKFSINWTKVNATQRYFPWMAIKVPNTQNPDYPVSLILDGVIMGGG